MCAFAQLFEVAGRKLENPAPLLPQLKRAVAATVANGTRGIAIARSLVAATSHQLGSGADIQEAIAKLVPLTPKEVPGVVYEV